MSSFKKLSKADITTVPYAANKQWKLVYNGITPNDEYAVGFLGRNRPFSSFKTTTTNGQYQALIYASINHLFYQQYTSSLNTGSLMFNIDTYESASSQRPTSSYFNYNANPLFVEQFPTDFSDAIGVLSINQNIYGNKILPNTFYISSSGINPIFIADDGNGNLYDIGSYADDYLNTGGINSSYFDDSTPGVGPLLVGNIFYAHGIITFTTSSYTNFITGVADKLISFKNEHIIYENEVRCIVRESDFNLSYNPTLVTGSYTNGILKDFVTGSLEFSGSYSNFQPYVTTIGLYNDENELLMVAKLSKPIVLSSDTDMTFIVKYDT